MMRWSLAALAICIGAVLIAGYGSSSDAADPQNIQEAAAVPAGRLDAVHTIGQSFRFHYPNLHAIEVRWIVSTDLQYSNGSRIVLHVRHREDDLSDIAAASVPLSALENNGFTRFEFSPIADSQGQPFYFFLDTSEATIERGYVSLWAGPAGGDAAGQMDLNGIPVDQELAFRAYYAPDLGLFLNSLIASTVRFLPWGPLALSGLFIAGIALQTLFVVAGVGNSAASVVALPGGLSLAALSFGSIALLFAGASVVWLALGGCAVLLAALAGARLGAFRHDPAPAAPTRARSLVLPACLAAFAILAFAVGLLQVRDALVPFWKDSPVHAGIIANILEQGRLPTSAFYHLGYHSIAALLADLSRVSIPNAMLFTGPLLTAQTGLSLFLLTRRLTGNDAAGLASAICVWFLSPTPSYFVTWGRYPLLLGSALLPLALLFVCDYLDAPALGGRKLLIVVITFWGLAFGHVRLAAFYLVFASIYLVWRFWSVQSKPARRPLLTSAAAAIVAGIPMAVLWLAPISANATAVAHMLPQGVIDYALDLPTAEQVVLSHHGLELVVIASLGTVIALARRRAGMVVVLVWFAALFGASLLPVVGPKYLPSSLVVLMGFIPASIVVGDLAGWLYDTTSSRSKRAAVVWVLTGFAVSVLGARDVVDIVNPATVLFTAADQNAQAWIGSHTTIDSTILIDSAPWFGPGDSPTDGGAWIPFVAGRSVRYLAAQLPSGETTASWIDANGIDYVYLSARQGILQRTDLICQPDRFAPVYDQEGITIYAVRGSGAARLAPRAGCAP
ncbi:MAG: hypothetical protein M1482_13870 [Chloroflexi bacterium]|nr:hypothetical protein [Chloroflexota bacterium]